MTGAVAGAVAVGCVAAAFGIAVAPRRADRRLSRVAPAAAGRSRPAPARISAPPVDPARWAAGLAGLALGLAVGGWFGILTGAAVAVALDRGLRRLEPPARRRQRSAEAALLPLAADLLAVALRGGSPAGPATAAVAEALPGPLGDRLARVGRVLALGGTPAQAWSALAEVPGAERLIRAAVRSAEHGTALAAALARLADDLRADRAIAADAAARRAAVLIVLPLGLCFLPAFVLAGLAPVVLAVLGDVL